MTYVVKYKSFPLGTGAAASTVSVPHGLGIAPKVVEVSWNGRTEAVNTQARKDLSGGRGFANTVAGIVQRCEAFASQDNIATATRVSKNTLRNDNAICTLTGAGAIDGLAGVQSVDATNVVFVINDQFSASLRVSMLCRGGTDITDVWVGDITAPTTGAGATADYTAPGFSPTDGRGYLQLLGTGATAHNTIGNDSTHNVGVATSATQQAVVSGGANHNNATTTQSRRYGTSSEILSLYNAAVTSTTVRAYFNAWIMNGFQLFWEELSAAAVILPCLVVKGPKFAIKQGLTGTADAADVTVSGVGFTPLAGTVLSAGREEATLDVSVSSDLNTFGFWHDVSNQGVHSWEDRTAQATSLVSTDILFDAVYEVPSDGVMALQAIQADGANYRMTAGDTNAEWFATVFEAAGGTAAFTASGAAVGTLAGSGSGVGTLIFNASGSPSGPTFLRLQSGSPARDAGVVIAGINAPGYQDAGPDMGAFEYIQAGPIGSGSGAGTLIFNASGSPARLLSAAGTSATVLLFNASGSPSRLLSATGSGTATNTPDTPVVHKKKRGQIRFVDEAPVQPTKRPKPKPVPVVPEAGALEPPAAWTEALFGPSLDPETLRRLAQFRVQSPQFSEHTPEVIPPIGDRLMAHFQQHFDMPAGGTTDNHEQFLETFLRDLGMEL